MRVNLRVCIFILVIFSFSFKSTQAIEPASFALFTLGSSVVKQMIAFAAGGGLGGTVSEAFIGGNRHEVLYTALCGAITGAAFGISAVAFMEPTSLSQAPTVLAMAASALLVTILRSIDEYEKDPDEYEKEVTIMRGNG